MNVYEKLAIVQKELKAPKGQFNTFGKYNYRSCEDIMEAVKPLCVDNGLVLTISDTIVLIGDRYYVKATSTVRDITNGDELSNDAYARESLDKKGMDESQITGSSSSYARKYALNGLFCIDDTKDADTNEQDKAIDKGKQESKKAEPKKQEPQKATKLNCNELLTIGFQKGYKAEAIEKMVLKKFNHGLEFITTEELQAMITGFKGLADKTEEKKEN
jgi:hypothetical protein